MMKYLFASSGWPEPNNSPAKPGVRKFAPGRAGAREDKYGLCRRIAERSVMRAQLGHDFAGLKAKVPRDPVALLRCRIVRGRSHRRYERERNCACDADANGIH